MNVSSAFNPETLHVLVIDDDPNVRHSLRCFLEDHGFNVCAVGSGEEAVEIASKQYFHFAIVDIRLSRMDGSEVIIQLSKLKNGTRFLIYTGSVEYRLPPELIALGMEQDQVYEKPVSDMNLFVEAMKKLWNRGIIV